MLYDFDNTVQTNPYDVYCLGNSEIKKSAFERKELLEKDVAFKQKFYYVKSAHYETATLQTISLIPKDEIIQPLRNDYAAMANMFDISFLS